MATEAVKITYIEAAAPSTPASGRTVVYAKADGLMYSKDDAGAETLMSGGASGAMATDAIWDAAGDLAVGSGANTAARLAIGAAATGLASNGTTAVWQFPPLIGAKAYMAATQAIANNTSTACTFDSEDWDSHAFHSTSSNTSRFTVPANMGGKYRLLGHIQFAQSATNLRQGWWQVNGTTVVRGSQETRSGASPGSAGCDMYVLGEVTLAAADYVELFAYQNSGGSLNIGHASTVGVQTTGAIHLIGV